MDPVLAPLRSPSNGATGVLVEKKMKAVKECKEYQEIKRGRCVNKPCEDPTMKRNKKGKCIHPKTKKSPSALGATKKKKVRLLHEAMSLESYKKRLKDSFELSSPSALGEMEGSPRGEPRGLPPNVEKKAVTKRLPKTPVCEEGFEVNNTTKKCRKKCGPEEERVNDKNCLKRCKNGLIRDETSNRCARVETASEKKTRIKEDLKRMGLDNSSEESAPKEKAPPQRRQPKKRICKDTEDYYEPNKSCLKKCAPTHERVGKKCLKRCKEGQRRNSRNVCVTDDGFLKESSSEDGAPLKTTYEKEQEEEKEVRKRRPKPHVTLKFTRNEEGQTESTLTMNGDQFQCTFDAKHPLNEEGRIESLHFTDGATPTFSVNGNEYECTKRDAPSKLSASASSSSSSSEKGEVVEVGDEEVGKEEEEEEEEEEQNSDSNELEELVSKHQKLPNETEKEYAERVKELERHEVAELERNHAIVAKKNNEIRLMKEKQKQDLIARKNEERIKSGLPPLMELPESAFLNNNQLVPWTEYYNMETGEPYTYAEQLNADRKKPPPGEYKVVYHDRDKRNPMTLAEAQEREKKGKEITVTERPKKRIAPLLVSKKDGGSRKGPRTKARKVRKTKTKKRWLFF